MSANESIILITGGNGGIGFELASQLLADESKHILLGARSAEKGEAAVKDLQSRKLPGKVEFIEVDVTSEESVKAAAASVESKHGRLDALVNNAALAFVPNMPLDKGMELCYRTNVIGPVLMVENFAPLLKKSNGTPRIVNVSTSQGSIAKRLDPTFEGYSNKGLQYRVSKTALNMVTACYAVEFGDQGFKVFTYCPGFTESNLSPFNNAKSGAKPTSDGASPIVKLLNGERDSEHACFVHGDGQHPW